MEPTSRSSSGCSTMNSSSRPFSITATLVSSFSTFTIISRFVFVRFNQLSNPIFISVESYFQYLSVINALVSVGSFGLTV